MSFLFRNSSSSNNGRHDWNYYTTTSVLTAKKQQPLSVKDAIKVLYPKTTHLDRHYYIHGSSGSSSRNTSRFTPLLLEHGEKALQDWAVIAYSNPITTPTDSQQSHPDGSYLNSKSSSANTTSGTIHWAQQQSTKKPTQASSSPKRKVNVSSQQKMMDKDSFPTAFMSKIEGRIYLCTASIIFEPNDPSRGIIRCPFHKMDGPPIEHIPSESSIETTSSIECISRRHIVMKTNNMIGPYQSITFPCRFTFTFIHSSPSTFLEICHKLYTIVTNTNKHKHQTSSSSSYSNTSSEIEVLLKPMYERPFDINNLVDVREQILTPSLKCNITTPLHNQPGIIILTTERIYFQETNGIGISNITSGGSDSDPNISSRAISWLQRNVVATARRYNGLRDSSIEIYWKDDSSTLFAFDRRHDREQVMRFLTNHTTIPCFTDRQFVILAAQEWQKGTIGNYEYILALNSAAGRSFHDLSRYPVFPWVIADYDSAKLDLTRESTFRDLSKPVGALNKERLEYFKQRLAGMQDMDEAFLFGTHYSAPGYVLYYLIRSMPEHMLCLQNGKFDAPDRIFDSVDQCYKSVLTNHADVKELIPEFYNDGNDFDFLINVKSLQLGSTQNGDRVNDVKLPPWAKSPRDFIKKNRKALESDICTRMLPKWIDLIFGCKSRGEGAIEADNIFHHNAYLGPSDLADMQTEESRFQAELQATEFGIVPDLLFKQSHPQKSDVFNDNFISIDIGRASSKDESGREAWELLDAPTYDVPTDNSSQITSSINNQLRHDAASGMYEASYTTESWQDPQTLATNKNNIGPLRGVGESIRNVDTLNNEQNYAIIDDPVSTNNPVLEDIPVLQSVIDGPSALSEWDINVLERKQIHSDSVSGCTLVLDNDISNLSLLVTTSLDGGLLVNTVELDEQVEDTTHSSGLVSPFTRFSYSSIINMAGQSGQVATKSKLSEYRTHTARDPLASLVLASDGAGGYIAFSGGHDDVIIAYGIKSACAVASVYSHRDAITGLDLIVRTPFHSESALWLENSTHILISGSWDATVKVWSASVASGETVAIHREPLAELFDADSSIVCVAATSSPTGGIIIAAGCADGSFCVWNVHNDRVQVLIYREPARRGGGQCSVVTCTSIGGSIYFYAAFSNGRLSSYSLTDGELRLEHAVSLDVTIASMIFMEGLLLAGCADGGLLLIPLHENKRFDAKPTRWKALNNKNTSPSICSMASTRYQDTCIVCTGGNDGSVVLFQLKRIH